MILPVLTLVALFIVSYLLGSIPFGLLLTKFAGLGDIRAIGSGNIGATNVLRTGKKSLAAATLILDALKGFVAVLLTLVPSLFIDLNDNAGALIVYIGPLIAGLGAFLGHLFPVWLKFKGGKGVAVYIGILLALHWPTGLLFCALWLGFALISKMSSVGALGASAIIPLVSASLSNGPLIVTTLILSALLWYKHQANIKRILNGSEPKIGNKNPPDQNSQ